MTVSINRAHPVLQMMITDWLELRLPVIHAQLKQRIETPRGDYLTLDEVAFRMTNAAIEVLEMAVVASGVAVDPTINQPAPVRAERKPGEPWPR